ncbi:MAG TPA: hypothetical protein VL137_02030 [Polyangiaceae bacterium]|nr:hypothetical protein [Polyangiaceae bacterium]
MSEPNSGSEGSPQSAESAAATPAPVEPPPKTDRSTLYWAVGIVALVFAELYYYGHNGELKVCVGKEGVHDFNLIGQMRTDENRWKFPFCEDRVNLGLRDEFDDLGRDAVKSACRRATLLHFQSEAADCVALENHWKRKVITRQVMPWERRFYRQLLWLDRH